MPGPVIKPTRAFAHSLLATALGGDVILTLLLYGGGRSDMKDDIICPKSTRRQRSSGDRPEPQSALLIAMSYYL